MCVCVFKEENYCCRGFWERFALDVLIQRGRYCLSVGLYRLLMLHKLNFNTEETPLLHRLMSLWCVGFDSTCVYCRKLCSKINMASSDEIGRGLWSQPGGAEKRRHFS